MTQVVRDLQEQRGTVFDSNKYTQLERHIFSDYRSYSATAAAAAGRKDWRCEKEEKEDRASIFSLCRKKRIELLHGDMFVSVMALRY